jgi:2-oxoisovalerate dehydrogenase E1 component alpha subunit
MYEMVDFLMPRMPSLTHTHLQASGYAYALKREGKSNVVICYFGEGAASEGDFHVALNFASTLDCPVLFFCRNNGYAISTASREQYRGDGIVSRGPGYGVASVRVDGNDLFAVHEVTAAARQYALENNRPVLIEAMTYRGGHHSTSDDSSRYRTQDEIDSWNASNNPITRTRKFLENRDLWDADQESALRQKARADVLAALSKAEKIVKPAKSQLFTDVYDTVDMPSIQIQIDQWNAHMAKYGKNYPGTEFYADEDTYVDPATY